MKNNSNGSITRNPETDFFAHANWNKIISALPKAMQNYLQNELAHFEQIIENNISTLLVASQPTRILDVGCGYGRIIKRLSDVFKNYNNIKIYGIDISENSINHCKQVLPKHSFSLDSIEHTRYENSFFDTIIMSYNLLGNLIDSESRIQAIEEIRRIIKPRGRLLFSVYSEESLNAQKEAYSKLGFKVKEEADLLEVHANFGTVKSKRFTQSELKYLFQDFNLSLIKKDFYYLGQARLRK